MRTDRVVSEVLGEEHALTPSDLYNAELKTNLFGGYSKNQVDLLLERAADVLETLIKRNKQLKQQVDEQQAEIQNFHDMEESLRSALVSSQKMSENITASARFQADALVEEARLAKAQAVFQMEQLPVKLREEIARLIEARQRVRDDIAAVLKSHEALLERIPLAEDAAEAFVREEVKHHYIALHDEESDDKDTEASAPNEVGQESPNAERQEPEGYVDI